MCRDFDARPIAPDDLDQIVRVGFSGPSAGNTDALDLLVLTDQAVQKYWDTTLSPQRRSEFPWPGLLSAPVLIIPVVNPDAYLQRYSESDKAHTGLGTEQDSWPVPYWWVDTGASVMAQMAAAESLGYSSLFFGQFNHEEAVKATFGIPDALRCVGTLAIGYARQGSNSSSQSTLRTKRHSTERIHPNGW